MTYITATDVRTSCGIPTSLATNTEIEHAIAVVEPQTERAMNTRFEPTKRIDILDGSGTDRFITDKNPVLRVDALKSDGDAIDVSTINIYSSSGKIMLGEDSSTSVFEQKERSVAIKYYYGLLEKVESLTATTDGAVSAGTSVDIEIDSDPGFSANEWVMIEGMDGNREVAQITNISSTTITVDKINFDHEDESTMTKLLIPYYIKRFMELEATLYLALNAIGATYTFNASYGLADFNVVKGVPYTHWKASFEKAVKEREGLRKMIKPRPKIMN